MRTRAKQAHSLCDYIVDTDVFIREQQRERQEPHCDSMRPPIHTCKCARAPDHRFFQVKDKLQDHKYSISKTFVKDVKLVFENALAYNNKDDEVYKQALKLQKKFEKSWKVKCVSTDGFVSQLVCLLAVSNRM